jgi:hypothetical protein
LDDQRKNFAEQRREMVLLREDYSITRSQLTLRTRQAERLKTELRGFEIQRHDSERSYNQKLAQISQLRESLAQRIDKNSKLAQSEEYLRDLEHKFVCMSHELHLRKVEKLALYYESARRVLVHRSIVMHPEKAMTVRYLRKLERKFVEMEGKLNRLIKNRDGLREQLTASQPKARSREQVEQHIIVWADTLQQKERDLDEMQAQLDQHSIAARRDMAQTARTSILNRRTIASHLKKKNLIFGRVDHSQFVTQPPVAARGRYKVAPPELPRLDLAAVGELCVTTCRAAETHRPAPRFRRW